MALLPILETQIGVMGNKRYIMGKVDFPAGFGGDGTFRTGLSVVEFGALTPDTITPPAEAPSFVREPDPLPGTVHIYSSGGAPLWFCFWGL